MYSYKENRNIEDIIHISCENESGIQKGKRESWEHIFVQTTLHHLK
jgi:hypothetical protein